MDEERKWASKRLHPRISWSFSVRFKPHESKNRGVWGVSLVKNISVGGCYFYSNIPYKIGQILDLEIKFPVLMEPMGFVGEVRRCEYNEEEKTGIYGLGVQFIEMDESKKDNFIKTVEFFLRKQSKVKG